MWLCCLHFAMLLKVSEEAAMHGGWTRFRGGAGARVRGEGAGTNAALHLTERMLALGGLLVALAGGGTQELGRHAGMW